MKTTLYNKWVIGLFCVSLSLGGLLTLVTQAPAIGKTVIKSMSQEITEATTPANKLFATITGFTSGIENGFKDYVYQKEFFVNWYGLGENLLGRHYIRDANPSNTVLKDNHDILQFITFKLDETHITNNLINLKAQLDAVNIPLLFVQAPNKVIEGFTELPPSVEDYSNENMDALLASLKNGGVNYLDLRTLAKEDELDKETLFYRTDHHWTNETALWATSKIIDAVNQETNLNLDANHIIKDPSSFQYTIYKNVFLGSQGRRVGKYYAGLDDYTLITPTFNTNYTVTIHKSDGSRTYEGDFNKAILREDYLDMSDTVYTNRYASYFGGDYPEVVIENKLNTDGKKLLIVKDSFAIPVSAYLSTAVQELRMLDIRYNTIDDVEAYAKEHQVDMVIFLCKSMKPLA